MEREKKISTSCLKLTKMAVTCYRKDPNIFAKIINHTNEVSFIIG
jgi:hypothetical protein